MELFEYLYRQSHLLRIYERSAIAELRYFVLTNSVQLNSFLLFEIAKSSQINAYKGINLKLLNALIAHRLSARITKPFAGKQVLRSSLLLAYHTPTQDPYGQAPLCSDGSLAGLSSVSLLEGVPSQPLRLCKNIR
ncbi:hypothetical protein OAH85_11065 [Paracoccaceae bacterium]|nr:hypothetical protein [Paracoccaceae bacterium]